MAGICSRHKPDLHERLRWTWSVDILLFAGAFRVSGAGVLLRGPGTHQPAFPGGGFWGALAHRQKAVSGRSEAHTSELQSLMRISYAVFCLKKITSSDTHR